MGTGCSTASTVSKGATSAPAKAEVKGKGGAPPVVPKRSLESGSASIETIDRKQLPDTSQEKIRSDDLSHPALNKIDSLKVIKEA